jgi:hypothetical protein
MGANVAEVLTFCADDPCCWSVTEYPLTVLRLLQCRFVLCECCGLAYVNLSARSHPELELLH